MISGFRLHVNEILA